MCQRLFQEVDFSSKSSLRSESDNWQGLDHDIPEAVLKPSIGLKAKAGKKFNHRNI